MLAIDQGRVVFVHELITKEQGEVHGRVTP